MATAQEKEDELKALEAQLKEFFGNRPVMVQVYNQNPGNFFETKPGVARVWLHVKISTSIRRYALNIDDQIAAHKLALEKAKEWAKGQGVN